MSRVRRLCRIDRLGCANCRSRTFSFSPVISDSLATSWELSRRERAHFDLREGHACSHCRMSCRVRMLLWSLKRILSPHQPLAILHLNQTNELSEPLSRAGSLTETAFAPTEPRGEMIHGLSNQDMTRLTFGDCSFDLVIHSETLEHIDNYELALREAHRVLRPGGYQVYTIPLIHRRATRQRIKLEPSGEPVYLHPLSCHGNEGEYPVFWEFGGDFLRMRRDQIFEIHYDNFWLNPTVFTVVEQKAL
ncbi:MAG: methyltransferase domain-containing protein [Terriglobia bacterium]